MSAVGPALGQVALLLVALVAAVPLLGAYLARVYTSDRHLLPERAAYRLLRLDPDADQHWRTYAFSVLGFSLGGLLLLYTLGRTQQWLPLSVGMEALPADGAWNTAVSFVTNTNWQWYSGEAALGHLMQASGLTVQNFVSAATGMCVAAAFARALARSSAPVGSAASGSTWCAPSASAPADVGARRARCWRAPGWCRTSPAPSRSRRRPAAPSR